jgi:hypothetical protein
MNLFLVEAFFERIAVAIVEKIKPAFNLIGGRIRKNSS